MAQEPSAERHCCVTQGSDQSRCTPSRARLMTSFFLLTYRLHGCRQHINNVVVDGLVAGHLELWPPRRLGREGRTRMFCVAGDMYRSRRRSSTSSVSRWRLKRLKTRHSRGRGLPGLPFERFADQKLRDNVSWMQLQQIFCRSSNEGSIKRFAANQDIVDNPPLEGEEHRMRGTALDVEPACAA